MDNDRYTRAAVTTAAIASVWAALKEGKVQAGGSFPPELLELLAAMATDLNAMLQILQAWPGSGGGASFRGWPPNTDQILTARFPIPAVGVAVQLPDYAVPDGYQLLVKSDPNNPGAPQLVYIANNAAGAINPNVAWPLTQNEVRGFFITTSKILWAATTAIPAWLDISVEKVV